MGEELALLDIDGGVATLRLHRPAKRNALSLELIDRLRARLSEVRADESVRAVVLTGSGQSFCAGMDLKAVLGEPGAPLRLLEGIAELTIEISELPAVVVACVNGAAIGGGCGIVAACDLAVTSPEAKLGFPEVGLGICPAVVTPWVHRTLGAARARRLLLEGGTISGRRAHELGLVSELAEPEGLRDRAAELARGIARSGAEALRATKSLLNRLDGEHLAERVRAGAGLSASVLASADTQERLRALFSPTAS